MGKLKGKVAHAVEVSNDSVNGSLVLWTRIEQQLSKVTSRSCNVRSGDSGNVIERSYWSLVEVNILLRSSAGVDVKAFCRHWCIRILGKGIQVACSGDRLNVTLLTEPQLPLTPVLYNMDAKKPLHVT
jgi:hypothetical protein